LQCGESPTFRVNVAFIFRIDEYAKQEAGGRQSSISTLKTEAIYSSESSGFSELHGFTTQHNVLFKVTAVRTSDPIDRVFEKRESENI
jgi:hypothetical protein